MTLWKVSVTQPASWLRVKPGIWWSSFPYELETRAVQLFQRAPKPDAINPAWPEPVQSHPVYFGGSECWKSVPRYPAVLRGCGSSTNPPHHSWLCPSRGFFCSGLSGGVYRGADYASTRSWDRSRSEQEVLIPVGIRSAKERVICRRGVCWSRVVFQECQN